MHFQYQGHFLFISATAHAAGGNESNTEVSIVKTSPKASSSLRKPQTKVTYFLAS